MLETFEEGGAPLLRLRPSVGGSGPGGSGCRAGLPPAAYPTDGAPHFERTHVVPGTFNSAVFYRGNILHSWVIDNAAPLSADPRTGRLTINAFFRPAAG